MPIITLTSDWQTHDFYLAAVKGQLFSICPTATIIDISHQIQTFNLAQAAFVIKNSYQYFPDNTIHIIAVKSEGNTDNNYIGVRHKNQYFICADNGILGLIFEQTILDEIVEIEKYPTFDLPTFPELVVFTNAAGHLANGGRIKDLGKIKANYRKQVPLQPVIENSVIIGRVIYIDSYQNAITNISSDLFYKVGKNRGFSIFVQTNKNKISQINKTYSETSDGDLLAIFNSLNLLEIAIYNGFAAELLGLDTNSTVRINFYGK